MDHNPGVGDDRGLPLPDVVHVECYAGYRGEQEPRRFITPDGAVEVVDVVDRWQGPDHRSFKVSGSDGAVTFSLGDSELYRLPFETGRLVAGFARTVNLRPETLRRLSEGSPG